MSARYFVWTCPGLHEGKLCGGLVVENDPVFGSSKLHLFPTRTLAEIAATAVEGEQDGTPGVVEIEIIRV